MTHSSPQGMKYNRSSLLSLENNYRHANGGAKLLTIRKLKSIYIMGKNLTFEIIYVTWVLKLVLTRWHSEALYRIERKNE